MKNKLIALFATLPIATFGAAGIALADDNITVINSNSASVVNVVKSKADTGGNLAGGSTGGNGGNGGSVFNTGSNNDANGNTTGAAGDGGAAGLGGWVVTGDAASGANAENHVNSNLTEITGCGCDREGETHTLVKNRNRAEVKNIVKAKAETGENTADGSTGGNGGTGGAVWNHGSSNDANDNTTGEAGDGGTGSTGGLVETGGSTSISWVLNYINRNVTRITR